MDVRKIGIKWEYYMYDNIQHRAFNQKDLQVCKNCKVRGGVFYV